MSIKQIDGYQIFMEQKCGQGSLSEIYLGKKDETDQKVAVKLVPKNSGTFGFSLEAIEASALMDRLNEQKLRLKKAQEESKIAFYDLLESTNFYYIVQDFKDEDVSRLDLTL